MKTTRTICRFLHNAIYANYPNTTPLSSPLQYTEFKT